MKIEFTEPEARTILFFLEKGAVESKPAFLPDQPALNVLSTAMRKIQKKLEDKERDEKELLVEKAVKLHNDVPDGGIIDMDTILADYMDSADFQVSGISEDMVKIWKDSCDRSAVEATFELFTEHTFRTWLEESIRKTTRRPNAIQ